MSIPDSLTREAKILSGFWSKFAGLSNSATFPWSSTEIFIFNQSFLIKNIIFLLFYFSMINYQKCDHNLPKILVESMMVLILWAIVIVVASAKFERIVFCNNSSVYQS